MSRKYIIGIRVVIKKAAQIRAAFFITMYSQSPLFN